MKRLNSYGYRGTARHNAARKYWLRFLFLLLIPLGFLIKGLLSLFPDFTEYTYSRGLFPIIMGSLSRLTGLLPFSLIEFIILFLVLFIPIKLVLLIIKAVRTPVGKLSVFLPFLSLAAMITGLWLFLQTLLWNINYERHSFAQSAGIETRESSVEELTQLCNYLIDTTNALRLKVEEDGEGVMTAPGGFASIADRAQVGYDALSKEYPFLGGNYGKAKGILFSRFMSHTNIIGIYTVITGEANVDTDIPQYEIASTTMHEMAHQRGFAPEDEANFIAWLACMAHPDVDFQYSGTVMALQYSMNALYGANADTYFQLVEKMGEGYSRDITASQAYWKQFQGITKKVATKVNDSYLKINGLEDGVKSYGRMVDLLLAYYRDNLQ